MSKHTEGPWEARQTRGNNVFEYTLSKMVGDIPGKLATIEFGNATEAEANARLIAAAPETKEQRDALLAACEELVANYQRDAKAAKVTGSPNVQYALDLGKAAIAKATV